MPLHFKYDVWQSVALNAIMRPFGPNAREAGSCTKNAFARSLSQPGFIELAITNALCVFLVISTVPVGVVVVVVVFFSADLTRLEWINKSGNCFGKCFWQTVARKRHYNLCVESRRDNTSLRTMCEMDGASKRVAKWLRE